MKPTFLVAFFCIVGLSPYVFSEEDRESIEIEMPNPSSTVKLVKGVILFQSEQLEAVSTANGFHFKCYCYMNGQRELVAQLEGDWNLKTADKSCKDFEGKLYKDYGIENRTGIPTMSITRSCSSLAVKNRPAPR